MHTQLDTIEEMSVSVPDRFEIVSYISDNGDKIYLMRYKYRYPVCCNKLYK